MFFQMCQRLDKNLFTKEALYFSIEDHDMVTKSAYTILRVGKRGLNRSIFTLWRHLESIVCLSVTLDTPLFFLLRYSLRLDEEIVT
jgi:hypothetical protein